MIARHIVESIVTPSIGPSHQKSWYSPLLSMGLVLLVFSFSCVVFYSQYNYLSMRKST